MFMFTLTYRSNYKGSVLAIRLYNPKITKCPERESNLLLNSLIYTLVWKIPEHFYIIGIKAFTKFYPLGIFPPIKYCTVKGRYYSQRCNLEQHFACGGIYAQTLWLQLCIRPSYSNCMLMFAIPPLLLFSGCVLPFLL